MPDGSNPAPDHRIKVLSCDPALQNWGLSKLLIDPVTLEIEVLEMKLIHTVSEAGKTVRKASDDLRRASEAWVPAYTWAMWSDLITAEVPSGTQSSRSAMGAGMSIMAIAGLNHFRTVIQVSPTEAKKASVGRATATKEEMIAWAMKLYPHKDWMLMKRKGAMIPIQANEHLADSLAIATAGIRTTEFRAAVRMALSMSTR